MTEKELMRIKRDLQSRAKKKHMGKARTDAYVYGTLRKIRGNRCWKGYAPVRGKKAYSKGSCRKVRRNPASFSEFRAYLTEILIPDLRDSGMNSTADDFETASYYMTRGRDKKYPAWRNFIMKTLVPDLKESGQVMTAKDFRTAIKYIDAGRSVVKNSARLQNNGGRKKTWKIGEYAIGGIIEAKVSQDGNAIAIRNAEYKDNSTISVRIFRWPLDKFKVEEYLNELTTSYYADKIIQWLMAGSWELRSNPATLSDAKLERAYRVLNRYRRLRELLNRYDVIELFPSVKMIREDASTMKILTLINKYFESTYHGRKLMSDSVQNALDAYVDETQEFLEANARSDAKGMPSISISRG